MPHFAPRVCVKRPELHDLTVGVATGGRPVPGIWRRCRVHNWGRWRAATPPGAPAAYRLVARATRSRFCAAAMSVATTASAAMHQIGVVGGRREAGAVHGQVRRPRARGARAPGSAPASSAPMSAVPEVKPRLRVVPWSPEAMPSSSRGTSESSALALGTENSPWPAPISARPANRCHGCGDTPSPESGDEAADGQRHAERGERARADAVREPPGGGGEEQRGDGQDHVPQAALLRVVAEHFLEVERHARAHRDRERLAEQRQHHRDAERAEQRCAAAAWDASARALDGGEERASSARPRRNSPARPGGSSPARGRARAPASAPPARRTTRPRRPEVERRRAGRRTVGGHASAQQPQREHAQRHVDEEQPAPRGVLDHEAAERRADRQPDARPWRRTRRAPCRAPRRGRPTPAAPRRWPTPSPRRCPAARARRSATRRVGAGAAQRRGQREERQAGGVHAPPPARSATRPAREQQAGDRDDVRRARPTRPW